jgi:hypothetical protein
MSPKPLDASNRLRKSACSAAKQIMKPWLRVVEADVNGKARQVGQGLGAVLRDQRAITADMTS